MKILWSPFKAIMNTANRTLHIYLKKDVTSRLIVELALLIYNGLMDHYDVHELR